MLSSGWHRSLLDQGSETGSGDRLGGREADFRHTGNERQRCAKPAGAS